MYMLYFWQLLFSRFCYLKSVATFLSTYCSGSWEFSIKSFLVKPELNVRKWYAQQANCQKNTKITFMVLQWCKSEGLP